MSTGKRYKFQGSTFAVQTGFGTPVNISTISAANPVVVTAANTLALGDIVKLTNIATPTQLDDGVFAVDNPTLSDFELAGINGSAYDAFADDSPATAQFTPITLSAFCELTGVNQQDGGADQEDVSTICSTAKEFEQGLSDSGTLQLDFNWAGNETVQTALREAKISGDQMAFKVTFPGTGGSVIMIGTVTSTSFQGAVNGVWTASASIKLTGDIYVLPA